MKRLSNWEQNWSAFVAEVRRTPFVWGESDCMILAGRNVEALTGEDLFSSHVGQYHSEREALVYLKTLGFQRPEDMVSQHLPKILVSMAQRGDLIAYQGNLGICLGRKSLFRGQEEVEYVDTLSCNAAWKVG